MPPCRRDPRGVTPNFSFEGERLTSKDSRLLQHLDLGSSRFIRVYCEPDQEGDKSDDYWIGRMYDADASPFDEAKILLHIERVEPQITSTYEIQTHFQHRQRRGPPPRRGETTPAAARR